MPLHKKDMQILIQLLDMNRKVIIYCPTPFGFVNFYVGQSE